MSQTLQSLHLNGLRRNISASWDSVHSQCESLRKVIETISLKATQRRQTVATLYIAAHLIAKGFTTQTEVIVNAFLQSQAKPSTDAKAVREFYLTRYI